MGDRAEEPATRPIARQSVTEIMVVPANVNSEGLLVPCASSATSPQQATAGRRASKCSVGMQLTILVAHNGAKLKADSRVVST